MHALVLSSAALNACLELFKAGWIFLSFISWKKSFWKWFHWYCFSMKLLFI